MNIQHYHTIENNPLELREQPVSYTHSRLKKRYEDLDNDLMQFMMLSKAGLYVDESTYWNNFYEDPDYKYEWNNGILEVKDMPTFDSAYCANWLHKILLEFLETNPIAIIVFTEISFTLNLPTKKAIRRPDLSIISKDNPVQPDNQDRSYNGIYDLCVEFLSDSKKSYVTNDTVEKKREYSQAGVREYYIIDEKKEHTAFYIRNATGRFVRIKPHQGIIRSTVLPGFQFRIKDIYSQPALFDLINDPVYQPYVKLDLQKERLEKNAALDEINRLKKIIAQQKK
jgi:Uma2 family endonuclease